MLNGTTSKGHGRFFRENWQIAYAVILLLLVPVAIVVNALFVAGRFSKTVDGELRRNVLSTGAAFNAAAAGILSDKTALQSEIEQFKAAIPDIKGMDVLWKDGDDFTVAASLNTETIDKPAVGRQHTLAWYDGQPLTYLTDAAEGRTWAVAMPLYNNDHQKLALLSLRMSLAQADEALKTDVFWSYAWTGIAVIIVLLLLAANTRLFQYAKLYRRLREVDEMKDDFISMASHELRAPVTAIRGYLSLFLDNAFGKLEEKPRDAMRTTMALANHLASLVEDLLDVSRIEQGRIQMDPSDLDLGLIIEETIAELRFEAEKKGLAFRYERAPGPQPRVHADPARLKQVLMNLLSNAIKYTPSGSIVVTSSNKAQEMVEIKVTDTGLGMPPEARAKLFQKFYRVRSDATASIAGTGLGLWVTKQIVELMGGKIFCESIENAGTQMSVLLPSATDVAGNGVSHHSSRHA